VRFATKATKAVKAIRAVKAISGLVKAPISTTKAFGATS
jgi:hypothetical protein